MFRVFSAVGKAVGELQHCNSRNSESRAKRMSSESRAKLA